ncbi:MAG: restriction endonuclease [Bacteroidetes bacterium HGW-Bacteroidetes-11]|jgi:type I restriction enzyme S subunit|nr:MAG: restriction endonuclease [Bacteroidetes bacterium HGW-Bacteroidetes-11]
MNNWNYFELGQIASIYNGSTPSTNNEDYWNGDIIWITPKDLSDQNQKYIIKGERTITQKALSNTKLLPNGTVLLSSRAPIGLLSIASTDLVTNQGFKNIVVNADILHNEFLYYYLKLKKNELNNLGSGTTFKELSKSTLEKYKIKFPDLPTQKSIAKVLSDLDAKIELNNKINRELEAMAKTLYDYWFVQFDFPNPSTSSGQAGKPYKSSGGTMVYNTELKREIPEGWEVKTISEWIKKDKNGDWGKETEEGNYQLKVTCIRGADLNGLNGNGELKPPTRFILVNNSNKLLENHDLIVEISGGSPTQSTGRLAFITEETLLRFQNPLICSNFCKALTLKEEKYLYNFVYQWNRLYDNGVLFGWEGKTSGIKNLLFESFVTKHKEVFPKYEIAEKFYDFVKPIQSQKQKNLLQNQQLSELRDWLLPMFMNGQVTVTEAEEKLNMAAEPSVEYKKG